jgi:lipoprotein-anchoring transpeptidase ErfK/SrfK
MRPLRVALFGILTLAAPALVACGPSTATGSHSVPAHANEAAPLALSITPASGTARLPVSTEVGLSVKNGAVTSVLMTRSDGTPVAGGLRPDGSSWIPDQPLAYGATYSAVVAARSADGRHTVTRATTFTTMATPANQDDYGMYLQTGVTYGVGMPVVLEFDPPVPASARAAIQSRLFVTSNPPQPGVWHWASGTQVWYRPPVYWQPGTTISVRAALKGVPFGDGGYGADDRTATVTIGSKVTMLVDNKTKSMYVYQNDKLTRTIPVSLGKPSTPSSSGLMVTMSHDYSTIFDTTREGPGGYRVQVYWAMRLTWGGEFIHAAPWSVGDQGHDNVSHGCVNMSDENSHWLFGITHIGDPVTVQGTEVKLVDGNGWTAWNESWPEFVAGSALPVPAALANWKPAPPPAAPAQAAPDQPSPTASPR